MDHADFQSFALRLADAARAQTIHRWTSGCSAEDKNVGGAFDPVTEADREAERAMRAMIERAFPDHGVKGEEFPERPARSRYHWSLDPVDGTRSFMCGLPTWVTLIALLEDGVPILGLIDAPCVGERYVGTATEAQLFAARGDAPLRTSSCNRIADARLSTTDPFLFAGAAAEAFDVVRSRARTTRYGHDGYGYARVAAGTLDLVIEAGLKPYDYNALIPVVRGAGGVIGDWSGGDAFPSGQVVAAATPALFEEAIGLLAPAAA